MGQNRPPDHLKLTPQDQIFFWHPILPIGSLEYQKTYQNTHLYGFLRQKCSSRPSFFLFFSDAKLCTHGPQTPDFGPSTSHFGTHTSFRDLKICRGVFFGALIPKNAVSEVFTKPIRFKTKKTFFPHFFRRFSLIFTVTLQIREGSTIFPSYFGLI